MAPVKMSSKSKQSLSLEEDDSDIIYLPQTSTCNSIDNESKEHVIDDITLKKDIEQQAKFKEEKKFQTLNKTINRKRRISYFPRTRLVKYHLRKPPCSRVSWASSGDSDEEQEDPIFLREQNIPEDVNVITYTFIKEDVIFIENSSNIYSIVHPVQRLSYEGLNFTSVDDVYQYYKLKEFCNPVDLHQYQMKMNVRDKRHFVKSCLARYGKTKEDVLKWREEKGLNHLFYANCEKFRQNNTLLLKMSLEKHMLIVNVYGEDRYDACGSIQCLNKWIKSNKEKDIKVPMVLNLRDLTVLPTIGNGKNIQGFIVMLARYALMRNGEI
uniref:DUF1768 domain-containing protein n=1 Tax=Parastrongyloides trichosuri TaxID=131310 RepID=A0A0N5A1C3_PARTI